MSKWPTVQLGTVLRLDLDRVPVDPSASYPMVGVLSFGRGLFERESIENAKTSYRIFNRLKAEHVVMSQLFGWEGALALSDERFAGRFLSPQFPTFLCDSDVLDRRFLGSFLKLPSLWDDLGSRASGMGDRRRTLTPDALFKCEIPLPPLSEQRRIAAKIEELSAQIHEARTLREQAAAASESLFVSIHLELSGARTARLGNVLHLDEDVSPIELHGSYPQVGVRSFGGGLFPKAAVAGSDTTYRSFNRLYTGALVLSQVKGWEGALAVCPPSLSGWYVSPEYRTFRCRQAEAIATYLDPVIRTEWFWTRLGSATRGVGARRERTRPEQFLDIEVPMPTVEQQHRGVAIFQELQNAIRLRTETTAELDALFPAILDRAFKGEL